MLFSRVKPISVICLLLVATALAHPVLPAQGQKIKADLKLKAEDTQKALTYEETAFLQAQAHLDKSDAGKSISSGDMQRSHKVRRSEPDPGEGNKGGGNQRIQTLHHKFVIPGIHAREVTHTKSKSAQGKRLEGVERMPDSHVLKKRSNVVDLRGVFAALGGEHQASTDQQKQKTV
ncbi:hypothetical protein BCR43DRAFT_547502 [Syncephalastrum racemosum]|uniref:Uncharacterized protein n=1 Tax=Syncephalastrum racemosum TaxID=13706 RepID=A0A1X2HDF8_SYNRA|nr:hypothetical protein BCR43DRAFT_547502 [Syncephalastrum racemosum]